MSICHSGDELVERLTNCNYEAEIGDEVTTIPDSTRR